MPITFPAHVAAILPLRRISRLPGTALLVGSGVPDYAFVAGSWPGIVSHRIDALLWFCLPVGLGVYFVLERWILPALRLSSPRVFQLGRICLSRGVPQGRAWGDAALAILIGAITHLVWDGLSHDGRFPAEWLYPGGSVQYLGTLITYPALMHRISSIGGSLIVIAFAVVMARKTPPVIGARPRAFPLILATTVAFGFLGDAARRAIPAADFMAAMWTVIVAAFLGLWLASVLTLRGVSEK